MDVIVFGATGPTGREVIREALRVGHSVTAFARDGARLGSLAEQVRVARGDARDADAVDAAISGQQAVICALGPRRRKGSADTPADIVSAGVRNIVAAMGKHGVRRLVFLSSVGVGDSKGRLQAGLVLGAFFEWILVPLVLRREFADKELAEQVVRGSELDWITVRPVKLVDRPARHRYRVAHDGSRLALAYSTISRADVAEFLVAQLVDDAHVRAAPVIGD